MAARQETAISADTEATGHHLTAVPQEATTHTAIQAAILQALHAHTQAAQALVQVQAQGHQALVAAEAVHAAVAASVAEAEEDKSMVGRRILDNE